MVSTGGSWAIREKAEGDAANRQSQNEVIGIMKPFTSQNSIGETDIVPDASRAQGSYFREKWQRLEAVRAK